LATLNRGKIRVFESEKPVSESRCRFFLILTNIRKN